MEEEFNDEAAAWDLLSSRGYRHRHGVIEFRPDKIGNMPSDEAAAIGYLLGEWDWAYE